MQNLNPTITFHRLGHDDKVRGGNRFLTTVSSCGAETLQRSSAWLRRAGEAREGRGEESEGKGLDDGVVTTTRVGWTKKKHPANVCVLYEARPRRSPSFKRAAPQTAFAAELRLPSLRSRARPRKPRRCLFWLLSSVASALEAASFSGHVEASSSGAVALPGLLLSWSLLLSSAIWTFCGCGSGASPPSF